MGTNSDGQYYVSLLPPDVRMHLSNYQTVMYIGTRPLPDSGSAIDEDTYMSTDVMLGTIAELEEETELDAIEGRLFEARDAVEVLFLEMGKMAAEIVDKKLYKLRQDTDGNYFRSAESYFRDLDRRFRERGQNFSYTSFNKFLGDYRLFIEGKSGVTLTPQEAVLVGKSNLEVMAPAVRQLQREGKAEEAVQLVTEVVEAAKANGGIPVAEVREAVATATGTTMKGLDIQFGPGIFGKRVTALNLWWDGRSTNLLKSEVTEEQAEWLSRRMGIKPGNLL